MMLLLLKVPCVVLYFFSVEVLTALSHSLLSKAVGFLENSSWTQISRNKLLLEREKMVRDEKKKKEGGERKKIEKYKKIKILSKKKE